VIGLQSNTLWTDLYRIIWFNVRCTLYIWRIICFIVNNRLTILETYHWAFRTSPHSVRNTCGHGGRGCSSLLRPPDGAAEAPRSHRESWMGSQWGLARRREGGTALSPGRGLSQKDSAARRVSTFLRQSARTQPNEPRRVITHRGRRIRGVFLRGKPRRTKEGKRAGVQVTWGERSSAGGETGEAGVGSDLSFLSFLFFLSEMWVAFRISGKEANPFREKTQSVCEFELQQLRSLWTMMGWVHVSAVWGTSRWLHVLTVTRRSDVIDHNIHISSLMKIPLLILLFSNLKAVCDVWCLFM